ncbi:hypothetical protein [Alteriqipengyuania lutimaris]|uniref:hypothetical protein n=1 Tax=Alteriqipengyuania lutimaris TaxID=1538146 RepID=UPI001CFD4E07|nr:hypothetical protein [Alteriqipengyuania lutimaris]
MTGNDEAVSLHAIEMVRGLQRGLAHQCFERGITPEDIALASIYSAYDIAAGAKGEGMVAVEWLRSGLDLIEGELFGDAT